MSLLYEVWSKKAELVSSVTNETKLVSSVTDETKIVSSVTDETKQPMKKSDENTSSDQSQAKILAMKIEGWPAC
jgi:hypothetical protein